MSKESGGFLEEVGGFWNQALSKVGDVAQEIADSQRKMAKENAPQPRKTYEERRSGYQRMGGGEGGILEEERSSSDGRSSSSVSSTSAASSQTGGNFTRTDSSSSANSESVRSQKSNGVVTNLTRVEERKAPFDSPQKASEFIGSKSERDKKASTRSALWGAASFCKSCLYNAGAFAFSSVSSVKKFFNANLVEPISKHFREPDASERLRIDESYEQILRERAAYDKALNEALKKSLLAPFLAARGALNETLEKERDFGLYKLRHDNQVGGWGIVRKQVDVGSIKNLGGTASQVPGGVATMGVKGAGLAGQGMKALRGGAGSVVKTTVGVAKFMATPGDSSNGRTWTERLQGARMLTEGMSSGYGPKSAGKDFAGWVTADNGVQTTGLPSGRGVAKFLARGAFNAASAGASMASRVASANPTVYILGR